ncbi:MAG: lysylphosphatidylglycerol synthase transmembrane domain-containing protein [Bacteroidales bacterium]
MIANAPRAKTRARGNYKNPLRAAIGAVLGVGALWLTFRHVDLSALRAAIGRVDPWWTAAALVSIVVSLVLGAYRWQLLFYPEQRERRVTGLFRALVIGQAVNIVLPLRLGEIARIYALAETDPISKMQVLATLAVEKTLDLAAFGATVAIVALAIAVPTGMTMRAPSLLVAAALAVTLWAMARYAERVTRWVGPHLGRMSGHPHLRAAAAIERFISGLGALRSQRAGVTCAVLTIAVLVAGVTCNYLLFRAFGLDLPWIAGLFLFVLLQVGSAPPSLPGKVGIFNYVTVLALSVYSVEHEVAVAYSVVLYAVALAPKILIAGVFAIARGGIRMSAPGLDATAPASRNR